MNGFPSYYEDWDAEDPGPDVGATKKSARSCRVCGCTDDRACPPTCWWVELDLCSRCAS